LAFGIRADDVRVVSPFVGGAFGAALRVWPHVLIAAMAARQIRRPVKIVLTRPQQYSVVGYRPATELHVSLGAKTDGMPTAIRFVGIGQTSQYERVR
jgi:xanthine dehydrogenase YagR molybdenum-binding subunit